MRRISVGSLAAQDIHSAADWYGAIHDRLRQGFLADLNRSFMWIGRSPQMYPAIRGDVRRALLRRFPFAIFFFVEPETVPVIAVMHNSRDAAAWQQRL